MAKHDPTQSLLDARRALGQDRRGVGRGRRNLLSDALEAGKDPVHVSSDGNVPYKWTSRQLADEAVRIYLATLDSLFQQSRGEAYGGDGISSDEAIQQARRAWSISYRARLFVIPPALYGAFYRAADMLTCDLAGVPWKDCPAEDTHKLIDVWTSGGDLPFPEPLPFDACFFAFPFLALGPQQWGMRMRKAEVDRLGIETIRFTGIMCAIEGETPIAFGSLGMRGSRLDGEVHAIVGIYDETKRKPVDDPLGDGNWYAPHALDPWILPAIIRYVNEHKVVVEEQAVGLSTKMDWKKARKKNRALQLPLPKPFYLLHLRDELVDESMHQREGQAPTAHRSPSHRFDVRGHEVIRVARGKLPIDTDAAHKLKERGYNIYDLGPIGTTDADRLFKRRVEPRKPDEWIAVLTYWRDAYVKGPEEKPYIPAVRIGSGGQS